MKVLVALIAVMAAFSLNAQDLKSKTPDNEISTGAYVSGGILGVFPGFGIGHAVQGRYAEKGAIFTIGELGSLGVALTGLVFVVGSIPHPHSNRGMGTLGYVGVGLMYAGAAGFVTFKVWEIVDVWASPKAASSNTKELALIATPNADLHSSTLGLQLRF